MCGGLQKVLPVVGPYSIRRASTLSLFPSHATSTKKAKPLVQSKWFPVTMLQQACFMVASISLDMSCHQRQKPRVSSSVIQVDISEPFGFQCVGARRSSYEFTGGKKDHDSLTDLRQCWSCQLHLAFCVALFIPPHWQPTLFQAF